MASPAKPTLSRRASSGKTAGSAAEAAPETPAPAIDQVLAGLERVVAELEAGDLPLETALKRFEDGVRLARQGTSLLDAVEQRVEILLEGRDEPAPFPGAARGADDDEEEENEDDENL